MEQWKEIPAFPGYYISNQGQVVSLKIPGAHGRIGSKIKPLFVTRTAKRNKQDAIRYCVVQLHHKGKCFQKLVHRLVLETFIGPCPQHHEARHLNGNSEDNRLDNLAWGTRAENITDQRQHGRTCKNNTFAAKLTAKQVCDIRFLLSQGRTQQSVAEQFHVSPSQISHISRRICWPDIKDPIQQARLVRLEEAKTND